MKTNSVIFRFAGCLVVATNMSGCVLLAAGAGAEAGYVASQDTKTTGEVIDDQVILASVKTKLLASSEVSGININVDCDKRIVTLRGFVRSQYELEKAFEIASGVSGVLEVISKLTIQN